MSLPYQPAPQAQDAHPTPGTAAHAGEPCPHCGTGFSAPEEPIPPFGKGVTCPACAHRFHLMHPDKHYRRTFSKDIAPYLLYRKRNQLVENLERDIGHIQAYERALAEQGLTIRNADRDRLHVFAGQNLSFAAAETFVDVMEELYNILLLSQAIGHHPLSGSPHPSPAAGVPGEKPTAGTDPVEIYAAHCRESGQADGLEERLVWLRTLEAHMASRGKSLASAGTRDISDFFSRHAADLEQFFDILSAFYELLLARGLVAENPLNELISALLNANPQLRGRLLGSRPPRRVPRRAPRRERRRSTDNGAKPSTPEPVGPGTGTTTVEKAVEGTVEAAGSDTWEPRPGWIDPEEAQGVQAPTIAPPGRRVPSLPHPQPTFSRYSRVTSSRTVARRRRRLFQATALTAALAIGGFVLFEAGLLEPLRNALSTGPTPAASLHTPLSLGTKARRKAFFQHGRTEFYARQNLPIDQGASTKINPLSPTWGVLDQGRTLFANYCAQCHGTGGTGGQAPALRLAGDGMLHKDAYLYWTIDQGGGPTGSDMPPFTSLLSREQIWSLVLFINTLS